MPVWVGSRRIASLVGRKVRFVAARPAIIMGRGEQKIKHSANQRTRAETHRFEKYAPLVHNEVIPH